MNRRADRALDAAALFAARLLVFGAAAGGAALAIVAAWRAGPALAEVLLFYATRPAS